MNQSSYWLFLSADSRFFISSCLFIGKSNKKTHFMLKFYAKIRQTIN